MTDYLTNNKYAELLGISRQGVGQAIECKRIYRCQHGIDPNHPVNVVYAAQLEKKRKATKQTSKTKKKEALKKKAKKRKLKDKNTKAITKVAEQALADASVAKYDIDDKKKLEETRLKRIQADKAAVEYAEKLKILMDDKTLRRKFGIFYDHILNDLIYMPESIGDMLANAARSADDLTSATDAITDILKTTLADIIKKGKRAARKVRPPKKGRKYVIRKAEK